MSFAGFNKITPINGFDTENNNAMQNNYAWSMSELGEYLYVGTGRNVFYNLFLSLMKSGSIPKIEIPEELTPNPVDSNAEIWRYNKTIPGAGWEKVYKSTPTPPVPPSTLPNVISGFRYMIRYTVPGGETALYAGAFTNQRVRTLRSVNGTDWIELPGDNLKGSSTRSMVIHNNKLYMATADEVSGSTLSYIYVYTPPTASLPQGSWTLVTDPGLVPMAEPFNPDKNPSGQVYIMSSFKGRLYAAITNTQEGFDLWRTDGPEPRVNEWTRVIDKGAGDALNKIPLTLGVFKDHLYVAPIMFPLFARQLLSFNAVKPFDVIRIDENDKWELVIGGAPVEPTTPTTGQRGRGLSNMPSGLGNPFNLYAWQLQEYNGEFYLGSFDWSVLVAPMLSTILPLDAALTQVQREEKLKNILNLILRYIIQPGFSLNPFNGFDLYKSRDGVHWMPISLNGLGNRHNYGARILFESTNGRLYLGTANPFDGCEVWVNRP